MSLSTGPGCMAIYRIRTISLGSVKTIFTDLAKDFPSTDFKHALIIHLNGDLEGESLLAAIRDDFLPFVDLYSDRALNKATIRVLRDLMIAKGIQVDRRQGMKITLAVARSIYEVGQVEIAVERMV
jgi:hypothetical protein